MKVVFCLDPVKYPLTGIGRYTYELASSLERISDIDLKFFQGVSIVKELSLPSESPGKLPGLKSRLLKSKLAVDIYRLFAPRIKSFALRNLADHIFHGPNFYLPPFRGRSVVTFHDISVYKWADCHPPERVRYMRSEIELSLKRASMLITDSEFIKEEVSAYFNWPVEKIRSIPLAGAGDFYWRDPNSLYEPLKKYSLSPGSYTLFVGTVEPRKNIETLLEAYGSMPDSVKRRWPLVIAGYKGWSSEKIHLRISKAEREGWVRYLGFVTTDFLPFLFAGARLFVFPSLYEGFGLPVLEAMASSVPVVCSDSASLPEVAGHAAALCDARDIDKLQQLIQNGIENEKWRSDAIKKGLEQASKFSWTRCANETLKVYRELAC